MTPHGPNFKVLPKTPETGRFHEFSHIFQINISIIISNYYCIIFHVVNNFMEPYLPGRKRLRSKDGDDICSPGMFYKLH